MNITQSLCKYKKNPRTIVVLGFFLLVEMGKEDISFVSCIGYWTKKNDKSILRKAEHVLDILLRC